MTANHPFPRTVRFWKSAARWQDAADTPWPQVAIGGRSNVGKSSLINRLVGRKGLARTSGTPGRTQLLNLFVLDERLVLVDLPGHGYAKAPVAVVRKWMATNRSFLGRSPQLVVVVLLVDIRRKPTEDDRAFVRQVHKAGRELVLAVTKADKVPRGRRQGCLQAIAEPLGLDPGSLIVTSATTGEGREALWERIAAGAFREGGGSGS